MNEIQPQINKLVFKEKIEMINENENLEMCKIQQKHFLHNLVCIKECEIEKDRYGNISYTKISPSTQEECFSAHLKSAKKLNQSTIQFILYVLHQVTTKKPKYRG